VGYLKAKSAVCVVRSSSAKVSMRQLPFQAVSVFQTQVVRYSTESARRIRGLRPWITNDEHNGLRADGERILGRLIDLARGRA
jgi:hypothetical protein